MKTVRLLFLICAVLLVQSSVFSQTADVNDGLTGFWSFDDVTNIEKDYSEYDNAGVDSNCTKIDGIVGGALGFEGNSVFRVHNTVADNPELNFTNQGGMSFWYKTTWPADNFRSVIRHESHFTPLQMTAFDGGGKAWCVVFPDSVGSYQGTLFEWTDGVYNDDAWHHMVVTFKGRELTEEDSVWVDVYWDGLLMTTGKFHGYGLMVDAENNYPWCFGATESDPVAEAWTGGLDQIRIYDRYLVQDDVDILFNEDTTPIPLPTTDVEDEEILPTGFKLQQNYPNPFNPTTKINYSLTEAGVVKLAVYDLLGREVAVLVNSYQSANSYDAQFNAADLTSGVYYYTLQVNGNIVGTKKMMLLK